MTDSKEKQVLKKEVIITFNGELLHAEGNSIEYKSLFDVVESTAASITRFSSLMEQSGDVVFYVKPPKEKCFEMILEVAQWTGNVAIPLLPYANTISEAIANLVEFLKIKAAMKGEKLTKENIQKNEAGNVIIKDNKGSIVYYDNRKITNVNIVAAAADDVSLNKKLDKIGRAVRSSDRADSLSIGGNASDAVLIKKDEAHYLDYAEDMQERPDSIVGYVRKIDNKSLKGTLTIVENEKEKPVNFELGAPDNIRKIDALVTNLALAEAYKYRVRFIGERVTDNGKIKKIVVNDIEMLDQSFNFGSD